MSGQNGFFLIADITGYTSYLNTSELDHAQKILTNLLNLLVRQTKPPLILSRLAGDAVISYGIADGFLGGQTFLETLETTYVAFRRAIDLMVRNTTCPCNACRNIASLDLKFFVHYGEFLVQRLDAHDELIGADVNIIHRLLKNSVREKTGIAAYIMFSDAAIRSLGLVEHLPEMIAHEEPYESVGVIKTYVQDMHPVWEREKGRSQVTVAPDQELYRVGTDIALPPELVWDYASQPAYAAILLGGFRIEIEKRKAGRVSAGSVYQCYHGDSVLPNTILEWQPFERLVMQFELPIPIKGTTVIAEVRFEAVGMGTRVTVVYSKSAGSMAGRIMGDLGMRQRERTVQRNTDAFRDAIEADWTSQGRPFDLAAPVVAEAELGAAALASLTGH